jgi:hypothetical protein
MTLQQLLANSACRGRWASRDRPGRGSGQRRAVPASPATGSDRSAATAGP